MSVAEITALVMAAVALLGSLYASVRVHLKDGFQLSDLEAVRQDIEDELEKVWGLITDEEDDEKPKK